MKKSSILPVLTLFLMSALALPAFATPVILYDDTTSSSYKNIGFAVTSIEGFDSSSTNEAMTDSFQVTSYASVTSISMGVLLAPGYSLRDITWAITSTPSPAIKTGAGSGYSTPLEIGYATVFSSTQKNSSTSDVDDMISFSIPSLTLNAGTYWLEIYQITTKETGKANEAGEWDESGGLSTAYYQLIGSVFPAETFQILGNYKEAPPTPEPSSPIPEPSSFLLLGSGLAGLAGLVKRKLTA